MKRHLIFALVYFTAAGSVFAAYWLGGGDFERGATLGGTFVISVVVGFWAVGMADILDIVRRKK